MNRELGKATEYDADRVCDSLTVVLACRHLGPLAGAGGMESEPRPRAHPEIRTYPLHPFGALRAV